MKASKVRNAVLFLILCSLIILLCRIASVHQLASPRKLTNPLIHYFDFKELRPFRHKVEELVARQKEAGLVNEVAVYFRSLSDGIWFGIDERAPFVPASLVKVPLMIAYLKEAEKDPPLLKKKLAMNRPKQEFSQHFPSRSGIVQGKRYPVDALIRMMITESDNEAYLTLLANANIPVLEKTFLELGITKPYLSSGGYISLKSYVGIFRILYNGSYLNNAMSERALRYLAATAYKEGLVAGLPAGIRVAHKFGERTSKDAGIKQLHDVGIVYYPVNPYLLGIMTKGGDFDKLVQVIKEISALVYSEIDSQYREKGEVTFELSEE